MPTEFKTIAEQINYLRSTIQILENKQKGTTIELTREVLPLFRSMLNDLVVWEEYEEHKKYQKLLAACSELINCDHYEHFAVRLNDQENAALDKIKEIVASEAKLVADANQTALEFDEEEESFNDEIKGDYNKYEEAERMHRIQRDLK